MLLCFSMLPSFQLAEWEVMHASTATPCCTAVFATAVVLVTDVSDWFLAYSSFKQRI